MKNLILIAGLCSMENLDQTMKVAKKLKEITSKYPIDFIFKASFDKANRTSNNSYRGVGFSCGMEILRRVKEELNIKVLTDIHSVGQAIKIKYNYGFIDCLQIPAFLCRQTDIVKAIANTGAIINIKKGQFLAPEDMNHIIKKVESTGNKNIMLTERGTCFGYHNLIVDYRSFLIMKKTGYPVIFDATHAQQRPSNDKGISGGSREFTEPMILGAIACGVDGIFIEVHPSPNEAKSDKATSLYLDKIESLVKKMVKIKKSYDTLDTE